MPCGARRLPLPCRRGRLPRSLPSPGDFPFRPSSAARHSPPPAGGPYRLAACRSRSRRSRAARGPPSATRPPRLHRAPPAMQRRCPPARATLFRVRPMPRSSATGRGPGGSRKNRVSGIAGRCGARAARRCRSPTRFRRYRCSCRLSRGSPCRTTRCPPARFHITISGT